MVDNDIQVGDVVTLSEPKAVDWTVWRIHRGRRWSGIPEWVELLRRAETRHSRGGAMVRWTQRGVPASRLILLRRVDITPAELHTEMLSCGLPPDMGIPGYPNGMAVVREGRVIAA